MGFGSDLSCASNVRSLTTLKGAKFGFSADYFQKRWFGHRILMPPLGYEGAPQSWQKNGRPEKVGGVINSNICQASATDRSAASKMGVSRHMVPPARGLTQRKSLEAWSAKVSVLKRRRHGSLHPSDSFGVREEQAGVQTSSGARWARSCVCKSILHSPNTEGDGPKESGQYSCQQFA